MTREFFCQLKAEPDRGKRVVMIDEMLATVRAKIQAKVDAKGDTRNYGRFLRRLEGEKSREFFHSLKAEPDGAKRTAMLYANALADGTMTQAEVDEVNSAATDDERRAILARQSDESSARFSAWLKSLIEMICRPEWHPLSREAQLEAARIHDKQHPPNAARAAGSMPA